MICWFWLRTFIHQKRNEFWKKMSFHTFNAWRCGEEHRSFHIYVTKLQNWSVTIHSPYNLFIPEWILPVFSTTFVRIHPTKKCWFEASIPNPFLWKTFEASCHHHSDPPKLWFHLIAWWRRMFSGPTDEGDLFKESKISHLLKEGKSSFPATFQGDRISYLSCFWSVTLEGRIEKIPKLWMILNSQSFFFCRRSCKLAERMSKLVGIAFFNFFQAPGCTCAGRLYWQNGRHHFHVLANSLEQRKQNSCLGYVGDYTTQLSGDCNKSF